MYTVAAPARCASVPATVYIWVYGRGGPPPPTTVYTFIYRSVAICGCVRRLLTNHRVIGLGYIFVATACADDPPERLLRGETSTQVIRFVLRHTFNIAHN